MNLRQTNNVVTCLTCACQAVREALTHITESAEQKDQRIADAIWNRSWNVSIPAEEQEAFDHAEANPNHIMVRALDFGYSVNGV